MAAGTVMLSVGLAAGLLLQWLVVRWARQRGVVATPNSRSSHSQPTPTMGGLALVLVVITYFIYAAVANVIPGSASLAGPLTDALSNSDVRQGHMLAWWWLAGLMIMGVVGLVDDLRELSAWLRFVVQAATSAMLLFSLQLGLPLWLLVLIALAMVWFINLYNFMDGIDGIAAVQCLLFCVGVQILAWQLPGWSGALVWLLSGATLAFLAFNWPPAKIFMGDVGSQFLGLLLGGLVLYLWQQDFVPLVGSLILLAGFWFDATYTLCVRMATGQAYTQAHRSHLYQRLAQRRGHLWTTVAFLLYGLAWLLPLAFAATRHNRGDGAAADMATYSQVTLFGADPSAWWWLLPAVLPLALLCVYFRAGVMLPEPSPPPSDSGNA